MITIVNNAKQTRDFKLKNAAVQFLLLHVDFVGKIQTAANNWPCIIDETDTHDVGIDSLFAAIAGFNPKRGTFKGLFSRIFSRKLISVIRHKTSKRQGHDRNRPLQSDGKEELYAPSQDMATNIDAAELRGRLKAALSPYEFRLLELRMEGRTYLEVTRITNAEFGMRCGVKRTDNVLSRIRKRIPAIVAGDDGD